MYLLLFKEQKNKKNYKPNLPLYNISIDYLTLFYQIETEYNINLRLKIRFLDLS